MMKKKIDVKDGLWMEYPIVCCKMPRPIKLGKIGNEQSVGW